MVLISQLFLACCAGLLDRVRGGYPQGRPGWVGHLVRHGIGFLMTLIVTSNPWLLLAGTIAVGQLSWRQDNGWRGRWVTGVDKDFVLPMRWGVIWSLPLVVWCWCAPALAIYALSAPIGAWIGIEVASRLPSVPEVLDLRNAWPWSELITMPIIGILQIILMAIIL